jgi:hypothetical protein
MSVAENMMLDDSIPQRDRAVAGIISLSNRTKNSVRRIVAAAQQPSSLELKLRKRSTIMGLSPSRKRASTDCTRVLRGQVCPEGASSVCRSW